MENIQRVFGHQVRKLRKTLGYSQERLAMRGNVEDSDKPRIASTGTILEILLL